MISSHWFVKIIVSILMACPTYLPFFTLVNASKSMEHTRLKYKNDFKNPEEVVQYYCGRDASGFVWTGLLDIERKAFTLWKSIPDQDSFYIAKDYEVKKLKQTSSSAEVAVTYHLVGIGDGNGTRMPPTKSEIKVVFNLKKDQGRWKIASPDAASMAPIILESKFQGI